MTSKSALPITLLLALLTPALPAQSDGSPTLAKASPPAYPLEAKAAGIEGSVKLNGVVGTDGMMRNLRVLKGPVELRQAAIDAVMRWQYHPYLRDGKAVEVNTTVTVNFKMGNKQEKAEAQAKAQAELSQSSTSPVAPPNQ